jgi:RHS repeat-associated protein
VILQDNGTYSHEFVLRDHLGNTRVTFSDPNGDGEVTQADIKQINHYYPFGLNMEGNWNGAASANKYQYNGKEWNDDFGLGWNDYGARFYDPSVSRWWTADPMTETQESWSPYHFNYDNPINFIDFFGLKPEATNNLAICPTCPPDEKYDDHRNSEHLFTYFPETDEAIATGVETEIKGKRSNQSEESKKSPASIDIVGTIDNIGDRVDPFVGFATKYLADKVNTKLQHHSFSQAEGFNPSLKRVQPIKTIFGPIKAVNAVKAVSILGKVGFGLNVISAIKYGNDISNGETAKGVTGFVVMGAGIAITAFCPPCALGVIAGSAFYSLYLEDKIFEPQKQ